VIGSSLAKGVCRLWSDLGRVTFSRNVRSVIPLFRTKIKRALSYFIPEQGKSENETNKTLRLRPLVPNSVATPTQVITTSSSGSSIVISTVGNDRLEAIGHDGNVQSTITIP